MRRVRPGRCTRLGRIVTPMAVADGEERARGSFGGPKWGDAYAELSAAHSEGQLDVEDLERLAVAAYMVGRAGDCEDAWMRAHHAWLRRGEPERAAAVRSGTRSGSSSAATWLRRWGGSPAAGGSWRRAAATVSSRSGCGC